MATVKQARPTASTITRRLDEVYADDYRYPLQYQAEASTVPTRCCTEVFYAGSQHRGDGKANEYGGAGVTDTRGGPPRSQR